MSLCMSSARHAVVRSVSFTGFGNRPDLTPSSHDVRLIGINAGIFRFLSPMIWYSLRYPVSGIVIVSVMHSSFLHLSVGGWILLTTGVPKQMKGLGGKG